MFALKSKNTGNLVGVVGHAETGAAPLGVSYSLSFYSDNVWVVNDRKIAEKAAITNTPWYGAEYDTPENKYFGELEVVELFVKE